MEDEDKNSGKDRIRNEGQKRENEVKLNVKQNINRQKVKQNDTLQKNIRID